MVFLAFFLAPSRMCRAAEYSSRFLEQVVCGLSRDSASISLLAVYLELLPITLNSVWNRERYEVYVCF